MNGIVRSEPIVSMVPNETHSGKEGYFVVSGGASSLPGGGEVATLVTSATATRPVGVILDGGYINSSTLAGATQVPKMTTVCGHKFDGQVLVRTYSTPGTILAGSRLIVNSDGTVSLDPATGARIVVAEARQACSTAGVLIKATLLQPELFTA